ncbi:MAG TPA: PAS domain-containing protein [Chloroflexaceae bacterium]|nr:PAS domain-containing protein [Chloroflexaceae bacterium]
MAPSNPDRSDDEDDRDASLRARIADLEARLQRQAAELSSVYGLLGRERAERLRVEEELRRTQRLNETLFDRSPLSIQIFDREGFTQRMNEAQRELLGLPDVSYSVGTYNVLTDPLQVVSGASEDYQRAYAGEAVHLTDQSLDLALSANTWQTIRKTIRFNQDLVPILDEQGLVEAVVCFTEDIGDAYATRQALSTAAQLSEGLFEHAPLALQLFDRKGFSFRMNETNRRLLGAPSRDYGAGEFNVLTDPFMIAQGHAALYAKAYAGEVVRVPTVTLDFGDAGGSRGAIRQRARVEQVLFPILDDEGAVSAVVSCVLEVVAGGNGP